MMKQIGSQERGRGGGGAGTSTRLLLAALGTTILVARLWPILDLRSLTNLQAEVRVASSSARPKKNACSEGSTLRIGGGFLPIVPPSADSGDEAERSLWRLFERYADATAGGVIDVTKLNKSDIGDLRDIGKSIMGRNVSCGSPKSLTSSVAESDGLEHCFWNDDYVSGQALADFNFERHEWLWAVDSFREVLKDYPSDARCLAFLDAGVNVGDWASPMRLDVPGLTYLGIEGFPSTAAMAAANMLTSVEHHRQLGKDVAPTILLPFPLLPWKALEKARVDGGVCFDIIADNNLGGNAVDKAEAGCTPQSTAGATFFPHALKNFAVHYQSECGGDWPSVYLSKWDIQGYEFPALSSAMDWLQQRPPCFMVIEFTNTNPQNYAIMQLLTDLGYDAVWRNADGFQRQYEKPPQDPHWTAANATSIFEMYDKDMADQQFWFYMNYIFGFRDRKACIRRLLNGTSRLKSS
ncbi:hypothetical protein ACHAWF_001794 [Thalassiosira exigua]